MKAFNSILVAVLTISTVGLAASSALACHGGSGYGGYSSHYYPEVRRTYVKEPVNFAPTFAPAHSLIVVMPGDSWFSICSREYGNANIWNRIAEFNGMPQNLPLTSGMQLRLPVINPNGSLSHSSAPAAFAMPPQGFAGGVPQGLPQGMQGAQFGQQGGIPQANGFAPQGQQFAPQQQMGLPQGAPIGQQGGMPQANGFNAQGQGFAPQLQMGPFQGGQFGQQGSMPQTNGLNPQGQSFDPQQLPAGPPQGAQVSQQGQPVGPQAPNAPQAPEGEPKDGGTVAQRIAEQLTGILGQPEGLPAAPNAGPSDRPLPSIVIGSIMAINGQPLGENRGTVRLLVNGSPVALEIIEWSANAAKVRVPADLPAGAQAQIEILRADGSVVAKDAVQLAAGPKLATAN